MARLTKDHVHAGINSMRNILGTKFGHMKHIFGFDNCIAHQFLFLILLQIEIFLMKNKFYIIKYQSGFQHFTHDVPSDIPRIGVPDEVIWHSTPSFGMHKPIAFQALESHEAIRGSGTPSFGISRALAFQSLEYHGV